MTTKQKQFVEKLSGKEAFKIYGDLWKKDVHRAKEFWTAWESVHPEVKQERQEYATQTAQNAWDGAKYNRVIVDTPKQEIALDMQTQSYFAWNVKEPKLQAIFNLLSDMREHSRQELLDMFKEKGWEQDIEFRKHISDIRKYLAACQSPYEIPLNKNGSGYGVYQLKKKI